MIKMSCEIVQTPGCRVEVYLGLNGLLISVQLVPMRSKSIADR